MIHSYKLNGYNIVLDVNSGAVHVVDEMLYEMIQLLDKEGGERQLPQQYPAQELAALEGSINYEVVCGLSKRVPRVYLKNGWVDSIYNALLGEGGC